MAMRMAIMVIAAIKIKGALSFMFTPGFLIYVLPFTLVYMGWGDLSRLGRFRPGSGRWQGGVGP